MKKLLFTLAVVFTTSFAFANNDENGDKNAIQSEPKNEVTVQTESEEDDALYCKVTRPDGTVVECWFCNCSDLENGGKKTKDTNAELDKETPALKK